MSHKLPIGVSDFRKLRENNYYYIDKSLFIKEVINRSSEVLLLPRPRRFGKTLNLSMLRYFLEKREENLAPLFEGLAIEQDTEIMQHQGEYSVIFLTFKSCKGSSIEECLSQIRSLLIELYLEHQPQIYSQLNEYERKTYDKILTEEKQLIHWQNALKFLMRWFHQQTGKRVIVLLDEYDAPIHAGQEHGYYEEIVGFMKILLGNILKDNSDLEKGVVTGVLRIAKESIFSDLNNLDVLSLLRSEFDEYFGFTSAEIEKLSQDFALAELLETLKKWYNGYLFGNRVIYNPWSIISFLMSEDRFPRPYWINTASDSLLRDIITRTDPDFQEQIEILLSGSTITTELNENIVLRDLEYSESNIWSLLVFSGYLKPIKMIAQPILPFYELAIPNLEVYSFYQNTLKSWLHHRVGSKLLQKLLHALTKTDFKTFGQLLKEMVLTVLSFHDTAGNKPERVYHVFVLGLLTHLMDRYLIRSNRESGYGRYDVLMIPHNKEEPGFIFEFKKVNKPEEKNHKTAMKSALDQIKEKQYAVELRNQGVKNIWGIGVVVSGKQVWVESLKC
ncbi:AAA family ATPase [Candidatus Parabeggiatoa sp. HSG14]|uniref:AAA family ATPase n=1 Tax=Candidatus Parabeggiatoa sp. HSG14 TaxID=3055593 RepID=UPI0025A6FE5D|nr:AAA family ATPase [Thiotrichales bacterium HSG14]